MNSACHNELRTRMIANMSAHRSNISRRWKLLYNDSRQWRAHWLMLLKSRRDVFEWKVRSCFVYGSARLRLCTVKILRNTCDVVNCKLSEFAKIKAVSLWEIFLTPATFGLVYLEMENILCLLNERTFYHIILFLILFLFYFMLYTVRFYFK